MAQAVYVTAHLLTLTLAFIVWFIWQSSTDPDRKRINSLLTSVGMILQSLRLLQPLLYTSVAVCCTFWGWKIINFSVVDRMFCSIQTSTTSEAPLPPCTLINWAMLTLFTLCFTTLCTVASTTASVSIASKSWPSRFSIALVLMSGAYLHLLFWKHYLFSVPSPTASILNNHSVSGNHWSTWVWILPLVSYTFAQKVTVLQAAPVLCAILASALLYYCFEGVRGRVNVLAYLMWALFKVVERGATIYPYFNFRRGFFVAVRFVLFVVPLVPAFLRVAWEYLRSPTIVRDVEYRAGGYRCVLDIFLSSHLSPAGAGGESSAQKTKPSGNIVLVFVSGGAWMVGNKGWVSLAGIVLSKVGITFVAPDYPNFPEVNAETMVREMGYAMKWVLSNIQAYGGDPENVFLCGQSAGANMVATLMMRKALYDAEGKASPEMDYLNWGSHPIRGVLLTSGLYDLKHETSVFSSKGVSAWAVHQICDSDLERFSPTLLLQQPEFIHASAARCLPPIHLSCGAGDKTVPAQLTYTFAEALRQSGVPIEVQCYPGKSHTSVYVEDAIENKQNDPFITDLLKFLLAHQKCHNCSEVYSSSVPAPVTSGPNWDLRRPDWLMPAPQLVIDFARWVNPL